MKISSDLIKCFDSNNAVLVVGAGFSAASTSNKAASSWVNLIDAGIEQLRVSDDADSVLISMLEKMLDAFKESQDTQILIGAASQLRSALSKRGPEHFATFLRDSIGRAKLEDRSLVRAIKKLNVPVATTNYDSLLADGLGTNNIQTWNDKQGMLKILRDNQPGIAHLHGHWEKEETVIFSNADYHLLTRDDSAIFVESGIFLLKSFVFLGMGEGVLDPHFDHLIGLLCEKLSVNSAVHYILCLAKDEEVLRGKLSGKPIIPVVYGENYEDLPDFLSKLQRDLGKEGGSDGPAYERAWERIADDIHASRLHTSDSYDREDMDAATVLDTLVTPTFLPLSHEQYVHEKKKRERESDDELSGGEALEPLSISQVLTGDRCTVVVAEEHGGLSTALRWLSLELARSNGRKNVPIYLNRQAMSTNDRIKTLVNKEKKLLGINTKKDDNEPEIILAIDNVSYHESERFKTFCNDVSKETTIKTFIGCRTGEEQEIVRSLEDQGIAVQTVYLGKVSTRQVQEYAVIISPNISESLISKALSLINDEHLPRNPFTISLVLALLLQAKTRPDRFESQTDVLDEYMQMLLGYPGANLDARETLGVQNLDRLLVRLAEEFVIQRTGSLSAEECVRVLSELFDQNDWDEIPVDWLAKLNEMRVLRAEGTRYSFRQSSYLFLYAAKAAVRDPKFMALLLADPLYFAPVIKHCAALQRDNEELVKATQRLLSDWSSYLHSGRIFDKAPKLGAPEIDEAEVDEGAADSETKGDGPEAPSNVGGIEESPTVQSDYDLDNDKDVVPFPLDDMERRPEIIRLNIAVSLASTVLRDSDSVGNKNVKDSALLTTLHSWGVLIDLIETDEKIREGARQIIQDGVDRGHLKPEQVDEIAPLMHRDYSCLFVFSGIAENLRSKKLTPAIGRLSTSGKLFEQGSYAVSAAAMYDFSSRQKGWIERVVNYTNYLEMAWISTRFFPMLSRSLYVLDRMTAGEDVKLRELLIAQNRFMYDYSKIKNIKLYDSKFLKHFDEIRMRFRARGSIVRAQKRKGISR